MPRNIEIITYRIVIGISIGLAIAMVWAVLFFGGMSTDHAELIDRLDALEHNKARATARRFTADDATALMACLRIPYKDREACTQQIEATIARR